MTRVVWHGVDGSIERCRIEEGAHGVEVDSRVERGGQTYRYRLSADAAWCFTDLTLTSEAGALHVERTGGVWRVNGAARPDLVAAEEVDLALTPLTNTLPIRRLALAVGEAADIVTAYIDPAVDEITADPQRYTRLSADRYLYESLDSDFRRTIGVDATGVVVSYPGLFERAE